LFVLVRCRGKYEDAKLSDEEAGYIYRWAAAAAALAAALVAAAAAALAAAAPVAAVAAACKARTASDRGASYTEIRTASCC
jgi:hypothetical protein